MKVNTKNSVSLDFGSIKIKKSKMNSIQKKLSDKLYMEIRLNKDYHDYETSMRYGRPLNNIDDDLDIYILPSKVQSEKKQRQLKVQFLDFYSGNFVKNKKGETLKVILSEEASKNIKIVADEIATIFDKIKRGIIAKPKVNIKMFEAGKTDWAHLNPERYNSYKYDREQLEYPEATLYYNLSLQKNPNESLSEFAINELRKSHFCINEDQIL